MRLFKKIAMTIAALWCCMAVSAQTFEVDGIYYSIISGTQKVKVTYKGSSYDSYNEYSGNIEIPERVKYGDVYYIVTSIGKSAFESCYGLTSITLPNSLTSIGAYAFKSCWDLTSITLPNSLTSIGESAFEGCDDLTSITLPNSLTSIGNRVFRSCHKLKTVTLPNSLTSIGESAFESCNNLTSITLPNSLTSIGKWAFNYCSELKTVINLSNLFLASGDSSNGHVARYANEVINADGQIGDFYFNTSKNIHYLVAYIGSETEIKLPEKYEGENYEIGKYAFSGYTGLTSITLPNSVTNIGENAFQYCSGLTSITLPNSLTSIGNYAFQYCSGLTNITLPNSLTNIGDYAFAFCSGLTSITLPNSLTSIGERAFYSCTRLKSITLPNSLTSIGGSAFYKCENLKTVINLSNLSLKKGTISNGYVAYYADKVINADEQIGDFFFKTTDNIHYLIDYVGTKTEIELPKNYKGEKYEIGNKLFYNCTNITNVTIPNSVTNIGASAFYNCSGLTSIALPNSLKSIGASAFYNCSGLTSIALPNSVTSIEYDTFYGCSGLTTIILPKSLKSIGSLAFYNCSGLTSISLPNSLTSIGEEAFYGCEDLKKVINLSNLSLNKGTTSNGYVAYYADNIIDADEQIGGFCFKTTDNIHYLIYYVGTETEIKLPENYKGENYEIAKKAFYDCDNLINIALPNSLTNIGEEAFYGCRSLASITLPNSLTNIGDYAFAFCSGLTSITLPNSLTSIEDYAFYRCTRLKSITLPNSLTSIGAYAFASCSGLTSITLPNSLTNIRNGVFCGCNNLTSITLPNSLISIGNYAFSVCTNLTSITIASSLPPIVDEKCFDDNHYSNTTLYVPKGKLAVYQAADGWKEFLVIEDVVEVERYALKFIIDGEEYQIDSLGFREAIVFPEVPVKEGYTFGGWSEAPATMPMSDVTVEGTFVVNKYAVNYVVDGSVYKTDSVAYGDIIKLPELLVKEGYTFSGWSDVPKTMPVKDVIVNGSFKVNKYLVTFKIGEDVISADSLEYNTAVTLPEVPDKEGYTFNGWGDVAEVVPAHDLTYEGSYTINSYKLTYVVDGETIESMSVEYGAPITLKDAPEKTGYTFSGWSEAPETMPAKDVIVNGSFKVNKYLITFKIGEDVISADSLEYNTAVTLPEVPDKEGYTFNGWGDVAEVVPAHDLTYEGSYTINSYKLTYVVDGETIESMSVEYGAPITLKDAPEKTGYTFSGWSKVPATMPAKDVIVNGSFKVNKYLVTFKIGEDVISADSLEYNTAVTLPEVPDKEGYTFNGWGDVAEVVPAHDLTYEGSYTINSYKLTYVVDGETIESMSVEYGAPITLKDAPEKTGYTFSGWSKVPATMPAKDLEITGSYSINTYKLTYLVDGEVYISSYVTYGDAICPMSPPAKEGYLFSGWSEIPETMPAKDLEITGSYSINTYKLTYLVDGKVYLSTYVTYGDVISSMFPPTKEGFLFSGWSEIPETMPAHDVTVTGSFEVDGIETIITSNLVDVYTLQGVIVKSRIPVETLREELSTGIYIVNGKKFVVK